MFREANADRKEVAIDLSEMLSALSAALDITEGQPAGHSARTCIIGMRIARELNLPKDQLKALFYGLLLKDLGCSSNSSKVCYLFGGDERRAKCELKQTDWSSVVKSIGYIARNVAPEGTLIQKASRFAAVVAGGTREARNLVQIRCDRGATIARKLLLPELTAQSIYALDEHWNGHGYAGGLRGDAIPLSARIMSLAQTAEVFWRTGGVHAACEIAEQRSGSWFDPELVRTLISLRHDAHLLESMAAANPAAEAARLDPGDEVVVADEATLDRVAEGFAQVIDAKSPWTFCHSSGVANLAVGIGGILGMNAGRISNLRRAALLHDIGKLGVSNVILDKPGKLTADELTQMRRHPEFTLQILSWVKGFSDFARTAAAHHERLDGRGYHQGISGGELSLEVRILGVADMYEALAAKRPYRNDLNRDEIFAILNREAGVGLCANVVAALNAFLDQSHFVPQQVAA